MCGHLLLLLLFFAMSNCWVECMCVRVTAGGFLEPARGLEERCMWCVLCGLLLLRRSLDTS